jgi:uncharacterized phage protein (TIGR01671 family)
MREIKFRAYDKKYKDFSEEPFFRLLIAKDGQVYNTEEDHWYKPEERYVIQFYTGLKDKQDNEVYDGDLLRDDEAHYRVFWNYEAAAWDLERLEDGSNMIGFDCYTRSIVADIIGDSKLIGNIYENPNLIEK